MAEGVSVHDLGETPSRDACMERASKVLSGYLKEVGRYEVAVTDWIAYAWDIGPGDLGGGAKGEVIGPNDVTLPCPEMTGGLVNAFLVVHGEGTEQGCAEAADTLDALWRR